ncbi:uncharacterized protein MELLADRAFT_102065 [Melampsora larici-populina 98AG31]|uniref:Uncharacterized protein n=1 Tax=Melampsora larici-populina (strain 98AG31 / pathotype 3-4-7) TaxID=747676 RepID=F4R5W4_MELLP|nr:uncharacterized protein MELLADRAFT_102065 [Melampsora larici-populina 98AG31]EGG12183.1 hypothetical protein MELLADRAFT_102065 [Melampsora larici-populina 98AG31]
MNIEKIGSKWEEEIELINKIGINEALLNKLSVFVKAYGDLSSQGCCFPEEELDLSRILRKILLVEFLPKTEYMDFEICLELAEIKIEEGWDYLSSIISSDQRYLIFPSAPSLLLSS